MTSREEEEEEDGSVWENLPDELLDKVLAFMSIHTLVMSRLVCKHWNSKIKSKPFLEVHTHTPSREAPWLLACSSFNCRDNSSIYNPTLNRWFDLSLSFLPPYMRFPLTSIGGLIFLRAGLSNLGTLAVCNPITKTWRELPQMTYKRFNSLVGVYQDHHHHHRRHPHRHHCNSFKILVAGGTSECGGDYECSTEMYDSCTDTWTVLSDVPRNLTVKITVWTSKTVFCRGSLYCLTSARPYNLMSFDMNTRSWSEHRVPQPDHLYSSFLLKRKDRLLLVGGVGSDRACNEIHIWELQESKSESEFTKTEYSPGAKEYSGNHTLILPKWVAIEQMPRKHFDAFCMGNGREEPDLKCVGSGDDVIYFFKSSDSGALVCNLSHSPASWEWLPLCPLSRDVNNRFSVRCLFIHPTLLDASLRN